MHFRHVAPWLTPAVVLGLAAIAPAKEHYKATLDGTQEVPPNGSTATGSALIVIDPATNTLFYHVSYSGLSSAETAAHIHGYAPPGQNAGVVHALPAVNPKIGAWSYPAGNEPQIMAGLTYVNIHTMNFGGGEIRGQVVFEPATDIVSVLDGAQEVPPNVTTGLGVAAYNLDTAANTLAFDIRYGLLMGTESAAHFHTGAAGVNGGVIFVLPAGSPKIGVWNYLEAQEPGILLGAVYANIHTSFDGAGEIRGQFEFPSGAVGAELVIPGASEMSLLPAPNPLPHDDLALFYRAPEGELVSVEIVDVTGRVVRTVGTTTSTRTGIFAWDTRDDSGAKVAGGVYFARMRAGARETVSRFVVLR
jgi:hypothetical protein